MVLRLTGALRSWWRFCSDECAMPQRRRGSSLTRQFAPVLTSGRRGSAKSSLITEVQGVALQNEAAKVFWNKTISHG